MNHDAAFRSARPGARSQDIIRVGAPGATGWSLPRVVPLSLMS